MTDLQKAQIIRMRGLGHTYAEIAEALSLSINTVKSYVRRNSGQNQPCDICEYCGKPIVVLPKCRPRRFCSDACRMSFWKKNHTPVKTSYTLICENCGKPFTSVGNKHQRYCSHSCYIQARYGKGAENKK